ncbi:MAG: hypothetical protein K0R93_492 [Anaerosolibacter sp.]|jgi:arginyl-tRNA synthetase|uniref:DALR anticodon-binding domain-containing protein n=1 Tax=Anaerosolibacter sp. TaxID=1872527 RepID=UPI00261DC201|nr:DALR anticodon-binding domain-containing protein [Anaerosolibacter sp.]MDF2545594.1 hypothetical protein [Anaerosolibacter sp.]
MRNFREEIVDGIWEILKEASVSMSSKEEISVEAPKNKEFGDYTTNIALKAAKGLHRKPMDVALDLQQRLVVKYPWIERIAVAEPGFVNLFLGDQCLYRVLTGPAADYEEIFSKKDVAAHWRGRLNILLEEAEFKGDLKDMQYVYSRIHSILKLLREEGFKLEEAAEEQVVYGKTDLEKEVLRRLGDFSQYVEAAKKQDQPDEVLNYGIGLGKLFFKLHEKTLFRQLDRKQLYGALRILEAMGLVIKTILEAFEIEAPERM